MLLPCWALGTEPEDLLAIGASLSSVVGKVALRCIALIVPLCQDSFASRVLRIFRVLLGCLVRFLVLAGLVCAHSGQPFSFLLTR